MKFTCSHCGADLTNSGLHVVEIVQAVAPLDIHENDDGTIFLEYTGEPVIEDFEAKFKEFVCWNCNQALDPGTKLFKLLKQAYDEGPLL